MPIGKSKTRRKSLRPPDNYSYTNRPWSGSEESSTSSANGPLTASEPATRPTRFVATDFDLSPRSRFIATDFDLSAQSPDVSTEIQFRPTLGT